MFKFERFHNLNYKSNFPLSALSTGFVDNKKMQREKRFQGTQGNKSSINNYNNSNNNNNNNSNMYIEDKELDWDALTIKGTSQELEKAYLRLTSAPEPSTVRPEPILKKSLQMLKEKWNKTPDYLYTCEQLKSIRQDLTVQRIINEFTVQVYEYHGRLALENGDLGEFNQCQTQLKSLYEEGFSGCNLEFLAYRLLYHIFQNSSFDISKNLAEITPNNKNNNAVKHALKVREAVAMNNYHQLFQLYNKTPNCGRYLIDKFIKQARIQAFNTMLRAYKPTPLPIIWLQSELAFSDMKSCIQFINENNLVTTHDQETKQLMIDTKSCSNIT